MEENQSLNKVGSAGSTVLDITEETESCSHAAQPSQVSMQAYQQHSGYLFGKNTHLVMDYHISTSSVIDTQQYCNSPITWTTPSTQTATISNCSQSCNQTSFQQTELTISQNVEAKQQFTQSPAPDIITSSPYPISPISSHFPTLDTDSLFPELSSVLFFTSPTSSQSPSLLTPHPCSISPSSSQCSTLFPSSSWQTSQTSSPGPVLPTPSACPISSASSPIFSSFSSSPVLLIPEKINNPHVVHNQSSLDQQAKITIQNCEQSSQLSQPMQSSISRLGNTNTINSITSSLKQEDILSKRRDCAQQIQLMQDTSVSQMHQNDLQFAHFNSQGYQHSNEIQQNTSLWEHQNPQSVQCSLQTNRQNSQGDQQTPQITQQNYLGSQQDLPENPHMFQQNAQVYTQSQQKPPDLINFHQQPQQTLENYQQISWQSQNSHNNQPNNCQNLQTRLQNSLVPQQNIQTNQQNTWHHQHNFLSDQHYLCQPQLNLQISQQTTLQPQENFQTSLQNPNQPAQTQQINEQNTFQPQQNTMQPQKNLLTNQQTPCQPQHTLWACQQNPFQPEQNFQEGIQRNLYQSQQNNQINEQNTLQPHPNIQINQQNALLSQQNVWTNQQNLYQLEQNLQTIQQNPFQPQQNEQINQQNALQFQQNLQITQQNPHQLEQNILTNEKNEFQPLQNLHNQQNTLQPLQNLHNQQNTLQPLQNLHNQQNTLQPLQNLHNQHNTLQPLQNLHNQQNTLQSLQNLHNQHNTLQPLQNLHNQQNTLQPLQNLHNQHNTLQPLQNLHNQQNTLQPLQNLHNQPNTLQPLQNLHNQQNTLQPLQNLHNQQNTLQPLQNLHNQHNTLQPLQNLHNQQNTLQPLQNLHNQPNTLQPLQNLHNQQNTLQPLQNLHNQQNTLQPLQNLHIDQQNTLQLQQNLLTNQQNPWQPQHNIESNQQNAWQIQQNLKTDQQNTPQLQQSFLTHEEDPYQLVQNLPTNQQKPFQPEQNTQGQQNMWSSQILQTNQPYSTARLNLQTNQPCSTARLNLQTNQPCSTARLNLQTNQPCSTARLNLQTNQHNILKAIQKSEHTRQQQSQHCMHPYNQESGRELSIQQTQTASNLHPLDRDTSLNCAAASISHQSRKVKQQMSSQMLSEHAVQTGQPTSSSCTELLNFLIRNQETAVEEETMQIPSQFSCWVGEFITQQLFPCLQSLVNINYMDIENNQMYSQFLQELSTLGQLAATDLKKIQKKERQHKGKLTDKANDCGASSRNLMEIGQDMPSEEEQLVCQENNWDNLIKSADICHQEVKELASNIQEMAGKWFEYIKNLSQQICELRTLSDKFNKANLPNPEENLTTEMNEKSGCCMLLQYLSVVCGRLIDFMEKWRCLEAWKYVQLTPTPDYMIVKTRYDEFGAMYTTYFDCLSIVESRIVRLQEILLDVGVKSNLCAAKLELYKIKFKLLSVSWFYETQPPTCCLPKDKMDLYIRLFGVTHSDIDEEKSEIYVFPQASYEKRMDKAYLCKESLKFEKCQSGNAARKQKVRVVVSILPSINCKRRSESLCFEQMHRICLVIQLKPNLGQDIGPKIEYKLSPTFTKMSTIGQVVRMLQAVIGTRDPERILDKHEILSLKSMLKSVSHNDEISLKQFAKDPFNLHGKQVTEQGKQPAKQRKQSIKQGRTPTIERKQPIKQERKSNGDGEQPSDTSKKFSFFTWFMAAVNSYMFLKSCKMSGNWFFLNNELCPAARDVPDGSALIRASRSFIEEPGGENPYAYLTVHIYSGDRSDLMRVAIKFKFNAKPQAFVDWLKLVTNKNKLQMIRTILPQKTPLEEFKDSNNEEEQTNNYRTRYKELPSTTIILEQQLEEMSLYADSDLSHLAE